MANIDEHIYYLHAIIVHKGINIKRGHYFVYVRDIRKDQWIRFDDSVVTYVNFFFFLIKCTISNVHYQVCVFIEI